MNKWKFNVQFCTEGKIGTIIEEGIEVEAVALHTALRDLGRELKKMGWRKRGDAPRLEISLYSVEKKEG